MKMTLVPQDKPRGSLMTKLSEWQLAMLEKLVADEMERARKSCPPSDRLNDLAVLRDTLEAADVLHAETFRPRRTETN